MKFLTIISFIWCIMFAYIINDMVKTRNDIIGVINLHSDVIIKNVCMINENRKQLYKVEKGFEDIDVILIEVLERLGINYHLIEEGK